MAQREWYPEEQRRRRRHSEERGERGREWEEEDEGYERGRSMYGQPSGYPWGQQYGQPYGWREREVGPFGYEQGRTGRGERRYEEERGYRGRYEGPGYEGREYEGPEHERGGYLGYGGAEYGGYGSERRRLEGREGREYERRGYERRGRRYEERGPVERAIERVGEFFGKGPKGYRRSDERIREDVCEALWRDPHVDASEIEVDVKNGDVVLRGTVDSRWTKRRAEEIIEDLSGVNDVHNQLRVQMQAETRLGGDNGRRTQATTQTPRT